MNPLSKMTNFPFYKKNPLFNCKCAKILHKLLNDLLATFKYTALWRQNIVALSHTD